MTQTKKAKEKTMRAIALDRFGGPETLKVQTVEIPEPGADEILIHAGSLRRRRTGLRRRPIEFSDTLTNF